MTSRASLQLSLQVQRYDRQSTVYMYKIFFITIPFAGSFSLHAPKFFSRLHSLRLSPLTGNLHAQYVSLCLLRTNVNVKNRYPGLLPFMCGNWSEFVLRKPCGRQCNLCVRKCCAGGAIMYAEMPWPKLFTVPEIKFLRLSFLGNLRAFYLMNLLVSAAFCSSSVTCFSSSVSMDLPRFR